MKPAPALVVVMQEPVRSPQARRRPVGPVSIPGPVCHTAPCDERTVVVRSPFEGGAGQPLVCGLDNEPTTEAHTIVPEVKHSHPKGMLQWVRKPMELDRCTPSEKQQIKLQKLGRCFVQDPLTGCCHLAIPLPKQPKDSSSPPATESVMSLGRRAALSVVDELAIIAADGTNLSQQEQAVAILGRAVLCGVDIAAVVPALLQLLDAHAQTPLAAQVALVLDMYALSPLLPEEERTKLPELMQSTNPDVRAMALRAYEFWSKQPPRM